MISEISLVGYGRDICKPDKKRVHLIPDFYMIHFIESGCGYFNGQQLSGGQAFICKQNELCNYYPDKNNPWTYTWINIKGKGADKLIKSLPFKGNVFLWNRFENTAALKKIWEFRGDRTAEELMSLSALYRILADQFFEKENKKTDYVSEAKILFESQFAQGITVEKVAKKLNISRAYLRNIFYKKEGRSPQNYLMELKMKRAAELLKNDYTITEIAAAVGYDDVLQFSKIFKKYFGLSPTNYKTKN